MISIVRNLVKSDVRVPEVLVVLVENIALLCKNGFNKQAGIEAIYLKGFIPLITTLLKDSDDSLKLSALKAVGTFATLAAIIPLRMQNLYKEMTD
jgi:hypothetical protein